MSTPLVDKPGGRSPDNLDPEPALDDVLCYMDQASFVGLRALGRQPVLHFVWLYPKLLDEADVNVLNQRIAHGFLGRLLQRSPWPWGRHRWVANPVPAPVTWFLNKIPVESLSQSRNVLAELSVDPEHGPGWRLAIQALEDGGCALSILVSHTIADGKAASLAIADAVADRRLCYKYPAPSWRWSPTMMARDLVETARSLPSTWLALRALMAQTPTVGTTALSSPPALSRWVKQREPEQALFVPLVQIFIDAEMSNRRASELGVRNNTLLAALSVRLAALMGRLCSDGRVKLVLPVSNRQPRDRRGNALTSVTVMVDPEACSNGLDILQDQLRAALVSQRQKGDGMSLMLPLIPYLPLWLVRRLERVALGSENPVGCSLVGALPPELGYICGDGLMYQLSVLESFTVSEMRRLGGHLLMVYFSVDKRIVVSVSAYAQECATTRIELMFLVQEALSSLGLTGSIH